MNTSIVCFLSVVALAAAIFIHNLFLLRRCERLRHGQRCWKAQAEYRKHEADELYAKLFRAQSREILLRRMLLRCGEARDTLITQIWGSLTITRDLTDVYTVICELRDRAANAERVARGLQVACEKYNEQSNEQRLEIERWMAQARSNAELVTTLMEQGWAITEAPMPVESIGKKYLIFDAKRQACPEIGEGESPEEAIADAATKVGLI